jgi:hypothetical protein
MFKLDNNFLISLGLGALPIDEKNKLLAHIYETLELNVGMKLAEQMSEQQLDEFEAYIGRNDEAGALQWLESNFPSYKQVVAEELEKLRVEISTAAPQILAAAGVAPDAPITGAVNPPAATGQPLPAGAPTPAPAQFAQQQPQMQPQQPIYQPQAAPQQPAYQQPAAQAFDQNMSQPYAAPAQPYTPAPQPAAPVATDWQRPSAPTPAPAQFAQPQQPQMQPQQPIYQPQAAPQQPAYQQPAAPAPQADPQVFQPTMPVDQSAASASAPGFEQQPPVNPFGNSQQ